MMIRHCGCRFRIQGPAILPFPVKVRLMLRLKFTFVIHCVLLLLQGTLAGNENQSATDYQAFVKQQALQLRRDDRVPETEARWHAQKQLLRDHLEQAWGGFPSEPCPLNPRILGSFQRPGYSVECLIFQTMPDVWMTANAYIPDSAGSSTQRLPAVLCVHGHWPGAKQDPVVQSRCIGLAKLGFFVLCVDAFGAGERAIETRLGEYHGEMTGALLLPTGRPLSGLQVYENMRAADYLQTRPEVDPDRLGITGASGGGNQTMYAGAFDERFRCVVPTCSVGTYHSYLSAACCMCEVVPGGLTFTEEGNILGMSANRGLMVISATQDAFQFSVDQAQISVNRAEQIGKLVNHSEVRHTIIESPHHYNQPMREAMYGWMTLHLKNQGNGSTITEPPLQTEDPETLRCFPGDSRPDSFVTLPEFAFREATRILNERTDNQDRLFLETMTQSNQQASDIRAMRTAALDALQKALGTAPTAAPLNLRISAGPNAASRRLTFDTETGLELFAYMDQSESDAGKPASSARTAVLLDIDTGAADLFSGVTAAELRAAGWRIVAAELRATGSLQVPSDTIGHAADHNSAEWGLWIGRPLAGQWVCDVRRAIDAVSEADGATPQTLAVVGFGSAGVVSLCAAALDTRISAAATVDSLSSYASSSPYRSQRLGIIVPAILPTVGDVQHIAALAAPRRVFIAGGISGDGQPLTSETIYRNFSFARQVYAAASAGTAFRILSTAELSAALSAE